MKIKEICDLLKQELYENGYQYGFYSEAESIRQISAMDLMLNILIYQRQFIVFKIRQTL